MCHCHRYPGLGLIIVGVLIVAAGACHVVGGGCHRAQLEQHVAEVCAKAAVQVQKQ